jgi:hypothetical protein
MQSLGEFVVFAVLVLIIWGIVELVQALQRL